MAKNKENIDTKETSKAPQIKEPSKSTNSVFVYANLPHGQIFLLSKTHVTIQGYSVKDLRLGDGQFISGGKYTVTVVPRDLWDEVTKLYGQMEIFKSGLIFAANSQAEGDAKAREMSELRHGVEPLDPQQTSSKPYISA